MPDRRIALVTGAGRGIGAAIARRLAEDGMVAVVNDVDEDKAHEVAGLLLEEGFVAFPVAGSVGESESADLIIEEVGREFGRLDVLVNNAGVTRPAMAHRMTDETWSYVIDVALTGTFYMCRAAFKLLRDGGVSSQGPNRKVVNLSSINGIYGTAANANYSAAKAGINGLTRTLSREWASYGINVNAIAPGYISGTRMTSALEDGSDFGLPVEVIRAVEEAIPIGRAGVPEDVAGVCSWLASSDSDYVCGQIVEVHGGMEIIKVNE
ncbi:MAG: 3-oxoacyl-ACP reductase [Acidimicrobiaceae bacterium]|nr:3-oxoacyl-ACP reductase [Acidimicrobiaceae bacterium]